MNTPSSTSRRPRLSRSCKKNGRPIDNPVVSLVLHSGTTYSPTESSSSRPTSPILMADDVSSSSTSNNDDDDDSPPTLDNIYSALHKIISVYTKTQYTRYEIVQSLKDLYRWVLTANNNDQEFYHNYLELDVIPHVLHFLTLPNIMTDMEYVSLIGSIITYCTYGGPNSDTIDFAEVMTLKFLENDGIQIMRRANKVVYSEGNNSQELKALNSIWTVFGNVVNLSCSSSSSNNSNNNDTITGIDWDTTLRLIDDALATLQLLNGVDNECWLPRILFSIFNTIAFVLNTSTASSTSTSTTPLTLTADDFDFEGKDFFQTCIGAMKKDSDDGKHDDWVYDEEVWSAASCIFTCCLLNKLFSSDAQNDTNDNDHHYLQLVVSFYVAYIKKSPNAAFKAQAFHFLRRASAVIGTNVMIEMTGLISTLGGVFDHTMDMHIDDITQEAAKALVKKLF